LRKRSVIWAAVWRVVYAWLRLTDVWLRAAWQLGGLGITARLSVRGRRTGRDRSVLVGLLRVDGIWYVGHPNGKADWTRNLEAIGTAEVRPWRGPPIAVRASRLPDGPERDAVIHATAHQQPFPGNILYRASRRHILAVGTYFRLTPI
jgi:deazaflavin-dependent oxidoreductase (nitroreductase family)